jgi:N-acetylmuramoyl-L-alanine amidase
MKNKFLLLILILFISFPLSAQVTGLAGWNVFVDPGHSQNENIGAYGYSEAHKVLRVGLNLREMLLSETDIDTVYLSRTNDQQSVSLTQRTDHANSVAAAWYHSIHSDAPSLTANSTLLLWGQYANGLEKVPNGGKAMSAIILDLLTKGYRTNTRGSIGDCTFYGCTGTGPYLAVNRLTTMPSELSEAGFHTNLIQNMINMNELWKRLEARTFYWSFLKFKNIVRPYVGIATGHVKDADAGFFINGAVVSINGQTITTDTYASLFYKYSTDPNLLRNGFFYFENLPPGNHTLTVTAAGYDPYSTQVTMLDTFFTFIDPLMISSTPPYIISTTPEPNDSIYPGVDNIIIQFSRPMDKASVENNLNISPSAGLSYSWSDNDKRLTILTANLAHGVDYSVTISGNSTDKYDHLFDGNGDGVGGDSYTLYFRTQLVDIYPPYIAHALPVEGSTYASLQPVINLTFSELLSIPTLSNKLKLVKTSDQSPVTGVTKYYQVNGRGVLSFFVRTELDQFTSYTVSVAPGIKDQKGNEITSEYEYSFSTGPQQSGTIIILDSFEGGISNWLQPTQNNMTTGVIASQTNISSASNIYNAVTNGVKSMRLNVVWDTTASAWLIREFFVGATYSIQSVFTLKVHLFGDGLKNKFRFCVRDGGGLEVSNWIDVDWYGWREVQWTPSIDGFGPLGDGVLTGTVVFDSYQFTYNPGSKNRGEYYIDDAVLINNPLVAVDDKPAKPRKYALEQNFPNPFNPATRINFSLAKEGNVKLEVFNLIGQKVASLINGTMHSGTHSVNFDAAELPSGVYIYKLTTQEFTSSKKLVIMK